MEIDNRRELKEISKEIHNLKKSVDELRGEIYVITMILQTKFMKKEKKEDGIE